MEHVLVSDKSWIGWETGNCLTCLCFLLCLLSVLCMHYVRHYTDTESIIIIKQQSFLRLSEGNGQVQKAYNSSYNFGASYTSNLNVPCQKLRNFGCPASDSHSADL